MKRTYLIGAIAVVLVIVLGFAFVFLRSGSDPDRAQEGTELTLPVSFEQEYEDGVHTISGSVTLANRCQTMEASAEALPDGTIRVDIIAPPDEELCLQVATEEEFSLDVEAAEGAPVMIYVNGELSTTTP